MRRKVLRDVDGRSIEIASTEPARDKTLVERARVTGGPPRAILQR
jgi:hypothetical protein